MLKFKHIAAKTAIASALLCAASASHANLILVQPENFNGSGLGAVNTILTIQGKNNNVVESGAVSYSAGGDVITGADTKTGASQTQTRSIGELGITSASTLRIIFNAAENDNMIDLTGLTLTIYSASGASLFTASLDHAYTNLDVLSGIGNSGFVFGLDAVEAAEAQASVFNLSDFTNARIGLSASTTSFSGGSETFFAAQSTLGGGAPPSGTVPEPASALLIGLGLAGIASIRRKRA